ncbi:MAG: hypothetical protein IJT94_15130, partial [Oscillibacter sp.]|nr:hypothetical protein [Oscillibacter sp.]
LNDLFSARGKTAPVGVEISDALAQLEAMYPDNNLRRTALSLLGEAASADGSVDSGRTAGKRYTGWISRYNSALKIGQTVGGGQTWDFRYQDVMNADLRKKLDAWTEEMPVLWVDFLDRNGRAEDMVPCKSPLSLARKLSEDGLYQEAAEQCKAASESPEGGEALGELIRVTLDWSRKDPQPGILNDTAAFFEARRDRYPDDAWHTAMVGQLYFALNDLASAVDYMRRTLEFPRLSPKLRVTFLAHFMRYCVRYYDENPDPALMQSVWDSAEEWLRLFQNSVLSDDYYSQQYYPRVLRWKCRAGCELDRPEEAEQDYLALLHAFPRDASLPDLRDAIRAARERADSRPKEAAAAGGEELSEPDKEPSEPDGETEPKAQAAEEEAPQGVEAVEQGPSLQTTLFPEEFPQLSIEDVPDAGQDAETDGGAAREEKEYEADSGALSEPDSPPYTECGGWDALHMTKRDAAAIALDVWTEEDVPAAEACLRAGAALYEELLPLSRLVSLAADAPRADAFPPVNGQQDTDGSQDADGQTGNQGGGIARLLSAVEAADPDYPRLNDCAAAAALLRLSFRAGREFEYGARSLRDGLAVTEDIPELKAVFALLDEFRAGAEVGIDACAGYRSHAARQKREELDGVVRLAEELYRKYILSPPRESARFRRLLETKKILFAQDGPLAVSLRMVKERDAAGLEAGKAAFAERFLDGGLTQITTEQVDAVIEDCWVQAMKALQIHKSAAALQGNRRNNLRSAVAEIVGVVCRWYDLADGEGIPNQGGEALYCRIEPALSAKLRDVAAACEALLPSGRDRKTGKSSGKNAVKGTGKKTGRKNGGKAGKAMRVRVAGAIHTDGRAAGNADGSSGAALGLLLLARTARELMAKLDGTWRVGQEQEFYAPLLRTDWILLDETLLPDLTATFCDLPDFNVFARFRAHLAARKPDWTARLAEIYGPDRTRNNYGTAKRIADYLRRNGQEAPIPENAERFTAQSALQAEVRLREFLENFALAQNRGQICPSDPFCAALDVSVQNWYRESVRTGNYGFFFRLLQSAEARISASAEQYGQRLLGQLDVMAADGAFEGRRDQEKAVRALVRRQNFLAAEDWMGQLRRGDFTLEFPCPAGLEVLQDFWRKYAGLHRRVADGGQTLAYALGRTEDGSPLAESWISAAAPANPESVERLLTLLGWRNPHAEPVDGPEAVFHVSVDLADSGNPDGGNPDGGNPDGGTRLYRPADALADRMAREGLYVVCLYGVYDSVRLLEKLDTLNKRDGVKLVLLDCALGEADRRAMARMMKQRGTENMELVVDRILAGYLATACPEDRVFPNLLLLTLPFAGIPKLGEPWLDGAETSVERPLPAAAALELLAVPLGGLGLFLPDRAAASQILTGAHYLPSLIRRYSRRLIETLGEADYAGYDVKSAPPYCLSDAHLRRVLSDRDFVEQLRETARRALGLDGSTPRCALALLAAWMEAEQPSETGYSAGDLLRHARELGLGALSGLEEEEIDRLLRELEGDGILRTVKGDAWLLASCGVRDLLGADAEISARLLAFGENDGERAKNTADSETEEAVDSEAEEPVDSETEEAVDSEAEELVDGGAEEVPYSETEGAADSGTKEEPDSGEVVQ